MVPNLATWCITLLSGNTKLRIEPGVVAVWLFSFTCDRGEVETRKGMMDRHEGQVDSQGQMKSWKSISIVIVEKKQKGPDYSARS